MEVKGGKENFGYVLLFEAIGTANLLYAINTSADDGGHMQPFAIGLTIFSNICIFGEVSGGHFNPAVTLGVLIAEGRAKFWGNFPYALAIMAAQITGAAAGCLSTLYSQFYLTKEGDLGGGSDLSPGIAALKPNAAVPTLERGNLQSLWSETLLTTLFVSVILTAKYLNGAQDLFLNALIIGLTLFAAVTIGGDVSGGCYNPAVGLVQIIF